MTERDVQNALYLRLYERRHTPIVPNCHGIGWEADMLSLKNNLVYEHEIKISRADYKADFKKAEKHRGLAEVRTGTGTVQSVSGFVWVPSYFYYAVPAGLLEGLDLPAYAGLVEVHSKHDRYTGRDWLDARVTKRAPKLHKIPIADSQRDSMIRSLEFRFWRERAA